MTPGLTPAMRDEPSSAPGLLRRLTRPRHRRLGHEYLLVSMGQLGALIVAMLSVKVITELLSVEEYGRLGMAMTLCGFLGMFIFAPLGQVVDRFAPEYTGTTNSRAFHLVVRSLFAWASGAALALAGTCALIPDVLGTAGLGLFPLSVLFAICAGSVTLAVAFLNAHRRRASVALVLTGDGAMRLSAAVLIAVILAPSATGVMAGYLLGSLCVLAALFALDRKSAAHAPEPGPSSDPRGVLLRDSLRYAWPFSVQAMFASVAIYADRWVIGAVLGVADAGLYYVMVQFASALVGIIAGPIVQFIQPVIYRRGAQRGAADGMITSQAILGRSVWIFVSLMVVAVPGVALTGPDLMNLITPTAYHTRVRLLWLVVLGVAVFQTAQMLAVIAQIHKRPELNILPKMLHAAAMAILSLLLVWQYGFEGVCVALVASAVIYLAAVLTVNRSLTTHGATAPKAGAVAPSDAPSRWAPTEDGG